jgi:hypothetical protein
MEDIHAVRHGMAMFYPGGLEQFLEAVLNNPEKARGLVRNAVGDLNARRSDDCRPAIGNGPGGLHAAKF